MFPNVKGEDRAEAVGNGVVGAGVLADGQGAGVIDLEPDPAGAEQADALGDELFLEGFNGAPLLLDLVFQRPGRGRFPVKPGMTGFYLALYASRARARMKRERWMSCLFRT